MAAHFQELNYPSHDFSQIPGVQKLMNMQLLQQFVNFSFSGNVYLKGFHAGLDVQEKCQIAKPEGREGERISSIEILI